MARPSSPRRTGKCLVSASTSRSALTPAPPPGAPAPGASSQQRVTWPASTTVSGGASTRQRSITDAQRGAKAQPAGSRARSGGWPSMAVSRAARAPRRGMDSSSARL